MRKFQKIMFRIRLRGNELNEFLINLWGFREGELDVLQKIIDNLAEKFGNMKEYLRERVNIDF